ncbi:MAG: hypothetical protein P8Q41_00850 [Saprospiraceae bacterium]|nr:hypothetical protein [Saprospiraceae bacterium]
MKIVYQLVLLIIILTSCNQPKQVENSSKKEIQEFEKEIVEEPKEEIKKPISKIEIQPLKSAYTESEMVKSFYVSDTIIKDFSKLIGTTDKWNYQFPTMFPARYDEKLRGVFKLNDSIRIIPFFNDGDAESEIFTKWKLNSDSTLSYKGRFKPTLFVKYSFAKILEAISVNEQKYFIGLTQGGEEGGDWISFWTAKYDDNDTFTKVVHYETGYHAGENMKSINYKIDGNKMEIILQIDSVNYDLDPQIKIPISTEVIKIVELK